MPSQQLGLFAPARDQAVATPSHEADELRATPRAQPGAEDVRVGGGGAIRVLFLADTHLGFDLPVRPRIVRRRRGHDFLANYDEALRPALEGRVDLVVHGGDVFHRSKVAATLAHQAFEPLRRVTEAGVPVFVVPGNHERGRIPHARLALGAGVQLFDRPRSFTLTVRGTRVALGGFPYERRHVRGKLPDLVRRTGLLQLEAGVRFLCLHHCVEGATVGPAGYVFRRNRDTIRGRDLPGGVAAVLSGHIHRHQVLTRNLSGQPMPAPVVYPGSVERTSFAEKDETKGYMILEIEPSVEGGSIRSRGFHPLYARPMIEREIAGAAKDRATLEADVDRVLAGLPADAVVKLRVEGHVDQAAAEALSAARLRSIAPDTMNVDAVFSDSRRRTARPRETPVVAPT